MAVIIGVALIALAIGFFSGYVVAVYDIPVHIEPCASEEPI
jgi:hypothetical protein